MAERLKAAVLKTVEGYPPSQGSNPCLSARHKENRPLGGFFYSLYSFVLPVMTAILGMSLIYECRSILATPPFSRSTMSTMPCSYWLWGFICVPHDSSMTHQIPPLSGVEIGVFFYFLKLYPNTIRVLKTYTGTVQKFRLK